MQGDPQVIQHLQAQLRNELTATNQYFLHYRILKHWGFDKLAKKEYEESIGEMKHADRLMERILVLDGLPNLQDLGKLLVGENVPEILDCDLRSERGAQATVKDGHRALRVGARLRLARDPRGHPRGHRGAHRLPRDPARPAGQGGPAELPAVADGRSQLAFRRACDPRSRWRRSGASSTVGRVHVALIHVIANAIDSHL